MKYLEFLFVFIIPFIYYLYYTIVYEYKSKVKKCMVIVFPISLLVIIIWKTILKEMLWYEIAIIPWITTSLVILGIRIYEDKKITISETYRLLFDLAFGVVSYSILTFGQSNIHSDIATSNLLIQTQLKYKSFFPKSWCYVNGDIWVLGPQLFVYPFYFLSNNQVLIRECGAWLNLIVVGIVIIYYFKKELKIDAWTVCFPVIFMFLYYNRDMNLYQAAYSFQITLSLLIITFCFRFFVGNNKKRNYVFYFILSVLSAMSG